ncbi:hypothetical protein [Priestia filamentosa]|uniref:hypothetical protein n=1 Tax=Priestia filamentosa TaxID=1402861 RepID=UPI000E72FAF8|nr:hypothetical protein [Priestia filamentosa]RJS63097.1 hypothetical protein CJ485_23115 [Priestia filamentosa]
MRIRGDVHWLSNETGAYLKIGEQVYSLVGIPIDQQEKYWKYISTGDTKTLSDDKQFKEFYSFLKSKGAFESKDIWTSYLYQQGIYVDSFQDILDSKKIAVVGDTDLINEFQDLYGKTFKNISTNVKDSDYGLLIIRSHKSKDIKKYNQQFIDNNTEFLPLLVQPFSYLLGPLVIPNETLCLNCVIEKKEKNLFYRKENQYFSNVMDSRNSSLPQPVVRQGIDLLVIELIKRILHYEGLAIESGVLDTILDFSMLENKLEQHNVMKDADCPICFPVNPLNREVIWMGKTK